MTLSRRSKILLGLTLGVGILVVGMQLGWWLRGPPKGMDELLKILDEARPKPVTDADWKAVSVKQSVAKVSGLEMPMVVGRNVRPLLEADALLSAQHIRVLNTREGAVLTSLVWSPKGHNALEFDWRSGSVKRQPPPKPDANGGDYLRPEETAASTRYQPGYLVGAPPNRFGKVELMISTPVSTRKLPWDRPSTLSSAYYLKDYRYASCIEHSDHGVVGMAIVDLDKIDLAGVIDLPPQVGRYGPLTIIDPNTDLLLCFDLDVAWIVCVDLRPGIDQSKKPWPPPWPHPALGPWDGRGDLEHANPTQLTPGKPIPPKPADWGKPE